ncbi:MAG: extensin family protein [Lentibacter algarum]
MGHVPGKISGCGINDAVKISAVSGVALMDCGTAKALKTWVETGVKPAFGRHAGGVSSLKVAAHYVCRTRNHKKGARISEHGKGRAIDISGFIMKNGIEYSVLRDYDKGKGGKAIRATHKAACGPFGTTLGPGSDGYHEDHLHFDTARYSGGPYCK